jgi:hypothetical protein
MLFKYQGKNPETNTYCLRLFFDIKQARLYAHSNIAKYPQYSITAPPGFESLSEYHPAKIIRLNH